MCVLLTLLGVSGASISVATHLGRQSTVCSSDATAARAEALQFELGEGPHWDAMSTRVPVLCSDLDGQDESRWPLFGEAARGLGIGAVFGFPMLMGAALVGVVDLYSLTARTVDRDFLAQASLLAGRTAIPAAQRALYSAAHHASEESALEPAMRREVHQATGMVVAQLNTSATAAFARLQGHALVTGQPIEAIAHQVVLGNLAFNDLPEETPRLEGD